MKHSKKSKQRQRATQLLCWDISLILGSLPSWFVSAVELLLRNRRFRVHMGDKTSAWRTQKNGLPQGSVLAPTLFNLYTNDLPVTLCRRFAYADDICCTMQAETFAELECVLTADIARITRYCQQWRLKPSVSKTVASAFHLQNTRAARELTVLMNGQRLKHDFTPVYLGVTLDRTLSYKTHLSKTAGKLKTRNNLLSKLAGTTWGAGAHTLRTTALALCYSVAEYCCPVWARSSFTHHVDSQLNSSMRLITGCLRSTPVPWLPVLANIAPPGLRRQAATDDMVSRILRNSSWPLHDDFVNHPPARLKSRRPIWSVDTTGVTDDLWRDAWVSASVVNHGLVPDPAVRPPGFDLPRQPWTLLNRFRTGHGTCRASLHRWGMAQSDLCQCGQRQTMTHIIDDCPQTKFAGGLEALHEADDDAVHWLQNTATKAFAK